MQIQNFRYCSSWFAARWPVVQDLVHKLMPELGPALAVCVDVFLNAWILQFMLERLHGMDKFIGTSLVGCNLALHLQ